MATKETKVEVFDHVAVCSGQHQSHAPPPIAGLKDFKGEVVHSSDYINAKPFVGKKVLIIGGGDSSADIVKHISDVSPKETYVSLRHGAHVTPRYFHKDTFPIDYAMNRWAFYVPHIVRTTLRNLRFRKLLEKIVKKESCEETKEILRILDMNGLSEEEYFTTKSAQMCKALASKQAILKPEIKTITPTGAEFHITCPKQKAANADVSPIEVDSIILCTGFKVHWPFLPKYQEHKHLDRYRLVFHPDLPGVGFVGFVRPSGLGAIPPLAEMQSRWVSAVWSGHVDLPSPDAMKAHCRKRREEFHKVRKFKNEMLVTFAYYITEIACQIGVNPPMFKLLISNPSLWWKVMYGPFTSHQFRLTGLHAKPDVAEEIIMKRITMPDQTKPSPLQRAPLPLLVILSTLSGMFASLPVVGDLFKCGFEEYL